MQLQRQNNLRNRQLTYPWESAQSNTVRATTFDITYLQGTRERTLTQSTADKAAAGHISTPNSLSSSERSHEPSAPATFFVSC
jgi:hypothetical protein